MPGSEGLKLTSTLCAWSLGLLSAPAHTVRRRRMSHFFHQTVLIHQEEKPFKVSSLPVSYNLALKTQTSILIKSIPLPKKEKKNISTTKQNLKVQSSKLKMKPRQLLPLLSRSLLPSAQQVTAATIQRSLLPLLSRSLLPSTQQVIVSLNFASHCCHNSAGHCCHYLAVTAATTHEVIATTAQ